MRTAKLAEVIGALLILLSVLLWGAPAMAQPATTQETATEEETPEVEAVEESTGEPTAEELEAEEQLRAGSAVYSQVCAACHQAGGIGLAGQFPPLVDNDNLDDAAYLEDVITNGLQGELSVAGVAYDGVMPSFSTLSDGDTDAVIAFIQNNLVAPAIAVVPQVGPVAGTELPALTNLTYALTVFISLGLAAVVLAPRVTSEESRLEFPWLDAWLRSSVIVASIILFTVIIPNWAIKNETVSSLSRFSQDLIGVSLWLAGLTAVLWGLWYAHGRSRI